MQTPDPDDLPLRTRAAAGLSQALMTAAAAWISYASSSLFGLHEGFWAAISAIVVMQSDITAAVKSSRDRFVGTAIGALIGWACASNWQRHVWIYAAAVACTVFLCWLARISAAGRLAAVAVTVIVLVPRTEAVWRVALLRFLEVSWGIAVALAVQLGVRAGLRRWRTAHAPGK